MRYMFQLDLLILFINSKINNIDAYRPLVRNNYNTNLSISTCEFRNTNEG